MLREAKGALPDALLQTDPTGLAMQPRSLHGLVDRGGSLWPCPWLLLLSAAATNASGNSLPPLPSPALVGDLHYTLINQPQQEKHQSTMKSEKWQQF